MRAGSKPTPVDTLNSADVCVATKKTAKSKVSAEHNNPQYSLKVPY